MLVRVKSAIFSSAEFDSSLAEQLDVLATVQRSVQTLISKEILCGKAAGIADDDENDKWYSDEEVEEDSEEDN